MVGVDELKLRFDTKLLSLPRMRMWLIVILLAFVATEVADAKPRKRKRKRTRAVATKITKLNILRDREVAEGVRYTEYRSNGKQPIDVHVVTVDRTIPNTAIRIVKGEDQSAGREMLREMSVRYGGKTGHNVLAMVNANFWAAVRNNPIGACVIDGEVVEMTAYKGWTSAFFDVNNRVAIDTFKLSGQVRWKGRSYTVTTTNRRADSTSVVVYNQFGGSSVPFVSAKKVQRLFDEAAKDSAFLTMDSTEQALTQETLRQEIARAQREADAEYPMVKLVVRYLGVPSVNRDVPCLVIGIDSGTVAMPPKGCIISMPRSVFLTGMPRINDTMVVSFSTNIQQGVRFMNAVCGTPRLVRAGKAKHEAFKEGSTGRRFIRQNLARTALGTDRTGNKLILVAVRATNSDTRTIGATLDQIATIMKLLGSYDAMNLDGGGSTGMVVEHDHVFYEGVDPDTRAVSVGLAVVKLSPVLRSTY